MAANVYVRVSGPALSFLLYENVKSPSDQEGFLLGEVVSHVTDTISDSQMRGEKTETLISVNSLMPIPNGLTFYSAIGKINHEKLKDFLKGKEKEVIGWYSFRRNSVLNPHLREKLLHKELCSSLSNISSEHFTMCLLNTSVNGPGSTHIFNHKFIRYRHRMFEALPVQIHNLGEAPQSEYKLVPSTACLSDSFNNIISSLRAGHEVSSDASLVCNIQRALQEHLWNLIKDLEQSEKQIAELEKEVDSLRQQTGPLSNEILLPQILKDEVPIPINNNTNVTTIDSSPPAEILSPLLSKTSKNLNHNGSESNHLEVSSAKEEVSVERKNSGDAFDFVTEMKIQMSQPQNSPAIGTGNTKRQGDRGRGGARGRGVRKTVQSKNTDQPDGTPNNRRSTQPRSMDSTPVSFKTNAQNINNFNTKPRTDYAQAVKRSNVESVTSKGSPISKTNATSNSPSNSEAQKY